MNKTEKMSLSLPEGTDYVDIQTLNENFKKLDALSPEDIGAATTNAYWANVQSASWVESDGYYCQEIPVPGIKATDTPIADVVCGEDIAANEIYIESMCKVMCIMANDDSITVWSKEAIASGFMIMLKVVRGG